MEFGLVGGGKELSDILRNPLGTPAHRQVATASTSSSPFANAPKASSIGLSGAA